MKLIDFKTFGGNFQANFYTRTLCEVYSPISMSSMNSKPVNNKFEIPTLEISTSGKDVTILIYFASMLITFICTAPEYMHGLWLSTRGVEPVAWPQSVFILHKKPNIGSDCEKEVKKEHTPLRRKTRKGRVSPAAAEFRRGFCKSHARLRLQEIEKFCRENRFIDSTVFRM